MKQTYFLIVFISCLCFSSNAQLRLLQNGRVQVGTLRLENEDVKNVTAMQVFWTLWRHAYRFETDVWRLWAV